MIYFHWLTPKIHEPNPHIVTSIRKSLMELQMDMKFVPHDHCGMLVMKDTDVHVFAGNLQNIQINHSKLLTTWRGRKYFWSIEEPYDADWTYSYSELFTGLFTIEKSSVDSYQNYFEEVYFMPLGIDKERITLSKISKSTEKKIHVAHIGTPYENRKREIERIYTTLSKKFDGIEMVHAGDKFQTNCKIKQVGRVSPKQADAIDQSTELTIVLGRDFDYSNRIMSLSADTPNIRFLEALCNARNVFLRSLDFDIDIFPDLAEHCSIYTFPNELTFALENILNKNENETLMHEKRVQLLEEKHSFNARLKQIESIVNVN